MLNIDITCLCQGVFTIFRNGDAFNAAISGNLGCRDDIFCLAQIRKEDGGIPEDMLRDAAGHAND